MDPIAYYAQQSPFTDPGEHISLFADLPRDIEGLCRTVQRLIIHYLDGEKLFDWTIPQERLQEVDLCYVERMLERIARALGRYVDIEFRRPETQEEALRALATVDPSPVGTGALGVGPISHRPDDLATAA